MSPNRNFGLRPAATESGGTETEAPAAALPRARIVEPAAVAAMVVGVVLTSSVAILLFLA